MVSISFTLAALATSAVPELNVTSVRPFESEGFAAAVVSDGERDLLVRVPRNQSAETELGAESLALTALTDGPRERLPFDVPRVLGVTRAGSSRAVVSTYLGGGVIQAEDLADDALLLEPIAQAIAAIHSLPRSVAAQGGLPVRSATDVRSRAARTVDRANRTRLLPETVHTRWSKVLSSADLWDFAPVIVHGSLSDDELRVDDDLVTGITGWGNLAVDDPAIDFAWLFAADAGAREQVIARYARARDTSDIARIRTRAALYRELEVAHWLLHGIESHEQSVVDDAVKMLDAMVGTQSALETDLEMSHRSPSLTEAEARRVLDETPDVVDFLSDTAAYDALDEDRVFAADTDFIDPLEEAAEAASQNSERTGDDIVHDDSQDASEASEASEASAGSPDESSERPTEPIDPEDLPR